MQPNAADRRRTDNGPGRHNPGTESLDLLDALRKRLNMAVVLITHDLGVVAERTERLMVMYAGKIVENGSTAAVFGAMRHPYAEALLESIPRN